MIRGEKSNLLVFIRLVMDVISHSIHSYIIKSRKSINCYHINFWGVLRGVIDKN